MEPSFLYHFARGLQPRIFVCEDPTDKFIYEENSEVSEMYFFIKGYLGIAINQLPLKTSESFYLVAQRRKGY